MNVKAVVEHQKHLNLVPKLPGQKVLEYSYQTTDYPGLGWVYIHLDRNNRDTQNLRCILRVQSQNNEEVVLKAGLVT